MRRMLMRGLLAATATCGLGILFGLSIAFAASSFFLGFFGFAGGMEIG